MIFKNKKPKPLPNNPEMFFFFSWRLSKGLETFFWMNTEKLSCRLRIHHKQTAALARTTCYWLFSSITRSNPSTRRKNIQRDISVKDDVRLFIFKYKLELVVPPFLTIPYFFTKHNNISYTETQTKMQI